MIKPNYTSFSVNVSRLVRNPKKTTHTLVPEIINNLYGIDILLWGLNQEPPSFFPHFPSLVRSVKIKWKLIYLPDQDHKLRIYS